MGSENPSVIQQEPSPAAYEEQPDPDDKLTYDRNICVAYKVTQYSASVDTPYQLLIRRLVEGQP